MGSKRLRLGSEEAGLDGWKVINRMADVGAEDAGHLDGLAIAMDLSEPEKVQLACAYTFERRAEEFVTLPA